MFCRIVTFDVFNLLEERPLLQRPFDNIYAIDGKGVHCGQEATGL